MQSQSKQQPQPHRYTVVICVFACATIPKYKAEILKIRETWYKRALEKNMLVLFFLGEEPVPDMVGDEYVYLTGVSNDYLSASAKQNLGIKYIVEQSVEQRTYDYDWIHVCGTDTFLWIDRICAFCNDIRAIAPPDANVAIGGNGDYRTVDPGVSTYFMSGGPGFLLSNRCSKLIYPYLEHMFEHWTRKCIDTNTEWLIAGCDVAISYYLQTITHTIIIRYDEHFLNLYHRIETSQTIACHPVSLSDFDRFHAVA